MTPTEYLEQIVLPNVEEATKDYANLRLAYNAIHAVDALAAHIFWAAGGKTAGLGDSDTAYRDRLAGSSEMFALLRDAAKAAKHVELVRGTPQVSSAKQLATRSLGYGEARFGEGRWGSPPQAVVSTNSGEHRVIEAVLRGALAVLQAEMTRLKL